MSTEEKPPEESKIEMATFLEGGALNTIYKISDVAEQKNASSSTISYRIPQCRFYCPTCEGVRRFNGDFRGSEIVQNYGGLKYDFLIYTCRDCSDFKKTFCLILKVFPDHSGEIIKLGELPDMSPGIPPELRQIAGSNYKYIQNGLKCEGRGFGIGAFAYYRRVVELQKGKLIDELIKVTLKEDVNADVSVLEAAKKEQQFSKAMEMAEGHIPRSLYIDGKNPLKVLHSALSVGVHNLEDEDCLTQAQAIRLVLFELSIRMRELTREHSELKKSLASLDAMRDKLGSGRSQT